MLESFLTIRAVVWGPMFVEMFLVLFFCLCLAFFILRIIGKKYDIVLKKRLIRLSNFSLAAGMAGLVFLFFNYEKAALLGSRIWFPILGVGFLVWLGFIVYDIFVRLPREKKAISEKEKFKKYLP